MPLPHSALRSATGYFPSMATVKVVIYPWLTTLLTDKRRSRSGHVLQEQEIAEGETIRTFLEKFVAREEKLRPHLFDPESGKFTDQVGIVVNDRFIDLLDGLDTRLKDGDRLMLFQAWSGG